MDTAIAARACPATLHIPLPAGAQAPLRARRAVARTLALRGDCCPAAVAEDIVLIVSELVTNAVLHAPGPYALTLSLEAGRARVEVGDGSAGLSGHRPAEDRPAPGGRGLKIVRALGADLFTRPSGRGKQVVAVLTW
ncbi:ATP-binding protein [Streptomyces sp. NPDC090112]|uniref:ATP-binding protein n=1 Tax=Streptomyces sp. NPDC090112 TaxID=3365949 RepID=UPI0037F42C50